jgi:hypothetical protein
LRVPRDSCVVNQAICTIVTTQAVLHSKFPCAHRSVRHRSGGYARNRRDEHLRSNHLLTPVLVHTKKTQIITGAASIAPQNRSSSPHASSRDIALVFIKHRSWKPVSDIRSRAALDIGRIKRPTTHKRAAGIHREAHAGSRTRGCRPVSRTWRLTPGSAATVQMMYRFANIYSDSPGTRP